jgi:hypothetical protein
MFQLRQNLISWFIVSSFLRLPMFRNSRQPTEYVRCKCGVSESRKRHLDDARMLSLPGFATLPGHRRHRIQALHRPNDIRLGSPTFGMLDSGPCRPDQAGPDIALTNITSTPHTICKRALLLAVWIGSVELRGHPLRTTPF